MLSPAGSGREVAPLFDHKTDQESVALEISWLLGGTPDNVKPPWKFLNYLLNSHSFCKDMKAGIRDTLITTLINTHSGLVPLAKNDFRHTQTAMLDVAIIKASTRMG